MKGPTVAELKAHALDRLDDVLDRLCPGGRRAGGAYTVSNPCMAKQNTPSFTVYLGGAAKGAFVDYADRDATKGDVIDLVSYVLAGGGGYQSKEARRQAFRWIEELCGLGGMTGQGRAAAFDRVRRRQGDEEREAAEAEKKRQRLWQRFLGAQPIEGSLAELYLRGRGVELGALLHPERDLRFLPAAEYWPLSEELALGRLPGPKMPAMLSAFRDRDGRFAGLHHTFLRPDGAAKADLPAGCQAKLMLGKVSGSVIRLTRGADDLTAEEAAEHGVLGTVMLAEGIEDGLSFAIAAPEVRVWAAGSLGNLGAAPALPCVDAWLLHRQNDANRTAVEAYERQKARLEATGRPVAEIAAPAGFKDLNDILRG